jgi:UDP-glucuronate decarboxylase
MTTGLGSLEDLLNRDLDYVCTNLRDEFSSIAGKNLLITGGAGFLGYYLVLAPLHWNKTADAASRIHVTVYDNFVRGMPAWLTAAASDPYLNVVRQNMIEPLPPDIGEFQFIVHAAGIASPTYYRKYPLQTIDANINGLRNLLDYSVRRADTNQPVEGFLFFSSSEIYGDPVAQAIPTPEDYRGNVSCTGPRACYDESKRFGETICVTFAQQYQMPVKIARPFNNYGPGLKITDGRVLPDFARDVLNGRDIVIYSDGTPRRTFCYAADAITGYYKVLVKGHAGESYNVGVERPEISISQLAEKVIATAGELFGYGGTVVHRRSSESVYLVDNPHRRCPSIEKARSHLHFNPSILIDEGLRRSLIWYHYHREAEAS